jgi:hypothetical protein
MRIRGISLEALFAVATGLGACTNPSAAGDDPSLLQVESGVLWLEALAANAGGDALTITAARIAADSLYLTLQYGGGCRRHEFALLAQSGFMESHPVQLAIAIRHRGNNDMCRALLTREVAFDLKRIRDAYTQGYQTLHGTIILRLRGYTEGIRYDF